MMITRKVHKQRFRYRQFSSEIWEIYVPTYPALHGPKQPPIRTPYPNFTEELTGGCGVLGSGAVSTYPF